MKLNFVTTIFISLFWSAQASSGESGQIYPFQYFEGLPVPFDPGESQVFPGVRASIQNSELDVETTNVLYIAPKKAKVAVTSFVTEEFAACQEVRNDSVVTAELSNIYNDIVDTYRTQASWELELTRDVVHAKRSCKEALVAKQADANDLCALAKSLSQLAAEGAQDLNSSLKELNNIRDSIALRMDTYGHQYGGTAGAIVELWDQTEVEKVRQLNPGKEVHVVPMRDIMFDFSADVEKESVIGHVIPRRSALSFSLQGQTRKTSDVGGSPEAITQIKTGQSTALGITLSRLGACSHAGLERLGTFVYNFDTYGYIKGEASYKRSEFYKRLKKTATEKGFFTTKTSRKLIEDMVSSQEISITAFGDDMVSQAEMEKRLRESLENDMLAEMAKRVTTDTLAADFSGALQAPTPGAVAAGDALLKCPDWRCQVGGYVLKTAAEIWGSGATDESFEKNWSATYTNKWSSTTIHTAHGSSSALVKFK